MTPRARPNLGGLFDGSTPADRTSGIAGPLGPRLVTAPAGRPGELATPVSPATEQAGDAPQPTIDDPASPRQGGSPRSIDPMAWIDPMRVLEMYFAVLQAALDANREFVMGFAGVLVTGGTRLRGGLDSMRSRS